MNPIAERTQRVPESDIDPTDWLDDDPDETPLYMAQSDGGSPQGAVSGCVFGLALTALCGAALWWLLWGVGAL